MISMSQKAYASLSGLAMSIILVGVVADSCVAQDKTRMETASVSGSAQDVTGSVDLETKAAKKSIAEVKTEEGIYRFLAGLALESFKKGDHVRAMQLARVIEHYWDRSELRRNMQANFPNNERKTDFAMDAFIGALGHPKTDGLAKSNVEAAYKDYMEELKPLSEVLREVITAKGIEAAIDRYRSLEKQGFPDMLTYEMDTNDLGYELLSEDKKEDAIKIFELNVEAYPKSANVYDSLGEAFASVGNKALAIENYRKALAIDPKMESSAKALKELGTN